MPNSLQASIVRGESIFTLEIKIFPYIVIFSILSIYRRFLNETGDMPPTGDAFDASSAMIQFIAILMPNVIK